MSFRERGGCWTNSVIRLSSTNKPNIGIGQTRNNKLHCPKQISLTSRSLGPKGRAPAMKAGFPQHLVEGQVRAGGLRLSRVASCGYGLAFPLHSFYPSGQLHNPWSRLASGTALAIFSFELPRACPLPLSSPISLASSFMARSTSGCSASISMRLPMRVLSLPMRALGTQHHLGRSRPHSSQCQPTRNGMF